jgi:hypothetical protein
MVNLFLWDYLFLFLKTPLQVFDAALNISPRLKEFKALFLKDSNLMALMFS